MTATLNLLLMGRFSTAALRASLAAAMSQVPARALKARLQAVLSVDVSAQLRKVEVPVLYLRAEHDRLVPKNACKQICRLQPRTPVVAIDAPRFLLQTAPELARRAVADFPDTLPGARAS